MTKRDFFRLIIKIFALYSLSITVFSYLPIQLNQFRYEFNLFVFLLALGFLAIIIGIYALIINKTDWLIDFLHLDKGFDDENIEIGNISSFGLIKVSLVIIGALLLVDFVPSFLAYTFQAFRKEISTESRFELIEGPDIESWVIAALSILVGYVLLTNYHLIARWMDQKDQEK